MSGNLLWGPHGPHGLSAFVWQTDLKDSEVWSIIFPTFSPKLVFGNFPSAESLTRYPEHLISFGILCNREVFHGAPVPDGDLQPETDSHSPWQTCMQP